MPMKQKYLSLMKDTAVFALGNLGSKLLLFFLLPLYTNCLSTAEYGTADLVETISSLLVPLVSLAIFDAVVRFALSPEFSKYDIIRTAFAVLLGGSAVTVLLTPLLGAYDTLAPWRWYICAYIISYITFQVELAYLRSTGRSVLFAGAGVGQTLLLAGLNLLLLLRFGLGLQGYFLALTLSNWSLVVLVGLFGGVFRDALRGRCSKDLLRRMLSYSCPLILNNLSWWVIHSSDKIMIEWMVGAATLGLFTVASKIPALINVVTSIFSQAWTVAAVREYENDNDRSFYANVFSVLILVVVLCGSCVIMLIKPFLNAYVGAEFADSWQLVPCLVFAACLYAVGSFYSTMFHVLKKSRIIMVTTLSTAALNILANYLLIGRFGAMGAAAATAISYTFLAISRAVGAGRYFYFPVRYRAMAAAFGLLLIQTVCVTAQWHPWMVSLGTMGLILVMNGPLLLSALKGLPKLLRGR